MPSYSYYGAHYLDICVSVNEMNIYIVAHNEIDDTLTQM